MKNSLQFSDVNETSHQTALECALNDVTNTNVSYDEQSKRYIIEREDGFGYKKTISINN